MTKNLVYGALAATSVAAATALVVPMMVTTTEPSHPTSCTVTLDANGGTFTVLETNRYEDAVAYSNRFDSVFNEDTSVTNYNFDLKGWTLTPGGTDFIANSDPVLSNTTAYAKWERSAIQKFNLVNGQFKGSDSGENYVAKFPAAFYGTATVTETNGHSISFIAPTSGTFRISFDPQIGWSRIYAAVTITGEKKSKSLTFGQSATVPVIFGDDYVYEFEQGVSYTIKLDFTGGMSKWGDIQSRYVFGIALVGICVKFDAGEYGTTYYQDDNFRNTGVNFTTNFPFGYLPTTKAVNTSISFQGWYSEKKGGVKIESSTLVGTNEIYYAHWKLPTYNYYVTFDKVASAAQGRKMPKQTFTSGVAQSLSVNRYYLAEHKFMGWDTDSAAENAVYTDGQSVTDIWDIPEGTCPLYAVWRETPGTNYFTVSQGVTNFSNVAISGLQTFANGTMSAPAFLLTVTDSATLRVSLDPKAGSERVGATLTVYKSLVGGSWSNVCTVTDLATTNTLYTFEAGQYRFTVTGASSTYGYVVGLGAESRQIGYKTCGVQDMSYSWSVETPYGYWPTLTSSSYGTHLGWFYNADITDTNQVDKSETVSSNATIYAHWSNQPYTIVFDGNGAENPTNAYTQEFYYDKPQKLICNRYSKTACKFLGWETTSSTNLFEDEQLVTNLCTVAGGTNRLYAVWLDTPGTNCLTVLEGSTNFTNVAVVGMRTFANGTMSAPTFLLTVTNSATLRVSLDPKAGSERVGATLTVYKSLVGGSWSNVCSVTDLATTNTMYSFEENATYRFVVTGASSTYGYVVGLGAESRQIGYKTCGVQDMSYSWSVETPYGYWPTLTSSYGTHLGWFYNADITDTNQVDKSETVSSNATIYAHWSNQPYTIVFDGNGAESPTNAYAQVFYYDKPQAIARNMYNWNGRRFLGWETASSTNRFEDGQVISNLCTIAGGTNKLFAVWELTPETNWYYVAGTMTNFENIAVSSENPSYFVGMGDATKFLVTKTNIAKCRVALDPQEGFPRVGATLTVECAEIPTNVTEELEWESACDEVSDLSDKAVTCEFTTNRCYRFTITGVAATNGYVVSIGAEGARYIFDACGGDFVGEEKTTKVKFYDWTVGSPIGYTPPVTTNDYVHGSNTWHYTPQVNATETNKIFNVTNCVVSGGEKLYSHWSDAVIVAIVFDWNLSALASTNIVFTNYYGQGADVYLYKDAYVRQPAYDSLGFLGWTTNAKSTAGWKIDEEMRPVTTNSPSYFYAQWTMEWKTSRVGEGTGLSIDGYYGTLGSTLEIPQQVKTADGVLWPVSVTAIGDSAFTNALFSTLELPETLTSIGSSAFYGCSAFAKLQIPAAVTSIGDSAFEDCTALMTVKFPDGDTPDEYTAIGDGGFLDGVFDEDNPSISLGTCLFKDCTSLTDVQLPLGVNCIPDECFSGCKALKSFDDMPYTVVKIGVEAFAGCTHLVTVTLKEAVATIGDNAFLKCARLKNVRFLGDQPGTVGDDIFKGTQRNVLVAYLENMCTTANEYCGGSWPDLPGTWPSGSDYARTLTWLGGSYPRRKVIFNYNDKESLYASTKKTVLYHSGRAFGLLAPKETEDGTEISWYTQPTGGRKIGNYWLVSTASEDDTSPITVYAHQNSEEKESGDTEIGSRSSEEYPVYWPGAGDGDFEEFTGFYTADDDIFYYSACTFDGIVFEKDGENENMITGLVSFVFSEGSYSASEGMSAPFTATITWNSGRKTTISGVADAEGHLVSSNRRWSFGEDDEATVITKSGIYGQLTDQTEGSVFRIFAARNRYASATEGAAWTVVKNCILATRGTWHVVLKAQDDPVGVGADYGYGYSTLVIVIADGGHATIKGTLGDGTAVSATSRLIIGDECCCLPVCIRPYSGKGGFSFMLWFTWHPDGSFKEEDATVQGLTGWDASMSSHPFTVDRLQCADDDNTLTFIDDRLCTGEKTFSATEISVEAPVSMNGKTWSVPTGEDVNPNKVKLSYDYTTGIFTGSFVYDFESGEKKAAVTGVLTDRIDVENSSDTYKGFGTAVIKGEGSCFVTIE